MSTKTVAEKKFTDNHPKTMYLLSYHKYAVRLPYIKEGNLPEVILPKGHLFQSEIARGIVPVLQISNAIWDRIMADEGMRGAYVSDERGEVFKDARGKVLYQLMDHVPERYRNQNTRVVELEQQNALYRNALRKAGVAIPGESEQPKAETREVPERERADNVDLGQAGFDPFHPRME